MKKSFYFLVLLITSILNAQNKEIEELKKIEASYDSILIAYQKKAKDSLVNLPKKERQKIMYKQEEVYIKQKKQMQEQLLYKIVNLEDQQEKIVATKTNIKCPNFSSSPFNLNFSKSKKYKPTPYIDDSNKKAKEIKTANATFIVDEYGQISNVRAFGSDLEFNKEVMLTLYLLDKLQPACNNGFAIKTRFRVPITLILE